jgi:hypothetical protein
MDSYGSITKGTGKGADAVIFYSPQDWQRKDSWDGPGFEPDEVLFHEMVHVTRIFRGLLTFKPVEGGGYGNEEEYLTTTLTNLYLSEKGEPLRGYYGSAPGCDKEVKSSGGYKFRVVCPPPKNYFVLKNPDRFYSDNPDKLSVSPRELMARFKASQIGFYEGLRSLPKGNPQFNPVRQHWSETFETWICRRLISTPWPVNLNGQHPRRD